MSTNVSYMPDDVELQNFDSMRYGDNWHSCSVAIFHKAIFFVFYPNCSAPNLWPKYAVLRSKGCQMTNTQLIPNNRNCLPHDVEMYL